MSLMISLYFAIAALWALTGTNTQARLTRQKMLEDEDPLMRLAVRRWAPGPTWLALPRARAKRRSIEADLRKHPDTWSRYQRLSQELGAWNALESSVALAFAAAMMSVVASLIGD